MELSSPNNNSFLNKKPVSVSRVTTTAETMTVRVTKYVFVDAEANVTGLTVKPLLPEALPVQGVVQTPPLKLVITHAIPTAQVHVNGLTANVKSVQEAVEIQGEEENKLIPEVVPIPYQQGGRSVEHPVAVRIVIFV